MEQKFIFVLIEKDREKADYLLGQKSEKVLNGISENEGYDYLYNGLISGKIELQTASSIEDFLGVPISEVCKSREIVPSDIINNHIETPKWICLDTRSKDFGTLNLPDIYPDYIVRKRHESGTYYPVLKKAGDPARYLFFRHEEGQHLSLYTSLLRDTWTFFMPFLQYILTDDLSSIEYWHQNLEEDDGLRTPVNIFPYDFNKDFPDEQTEIFIDLNTHNIEDLIDDIYNAGNSSFYAHCTLFYTDLTQNVIRNLTKYLDTIASNTAKFRKVSIRRYGALTAKRLVDNNKVSIWKNYWKNSWKNIINRWEEIYAKSPAHKANLKDIALPEILHISGQSECNLLLAALNLVSLPGNENICEISVQAVFNGKTLLEKNLLGKYGFDVTIKIETLSLLLQPDIRIESRKLNYKEVEITIYIFHRSVTHIHLDNEAMYRVETYLQLWIAEKLGNRIENNLIKFSYSQIMARNMSHNIGSHMIVNLQEQTEKIKSHCKSTGLHTSGETIDHLENIGIALEYIRLKSDYLSAFAFCGIGTTFQNTTVLSIKDHFDRYKSVFNTLPDRTINVQIDVQVKGQIVDENNNLKISLPISGEFALFNIIESVIRNCIKHEENKLDTINLVIDFGCKHSWHDKLASDEVNVQVYRKGSNYDDKTCKEINARIDESIIDSYSGQLNYRNLGLKEMKGAVFFLLGISPDEWEMQPKNPDSIFIKNEAHFTACRMENIDGDLAEWGYLFQIKRSNTILAVIDSDEEIENYRPTRKMIGYEDKNMVKTLDIPWERIDRLKKKLTEHKSEVVSYEFIVFSRISEEKISDFMDNVPDNRLPLRIVKLDLTNVSKENLEEKVWEAYYKDEKYVNGSITIKDINENKPCNIKPDLLPCSYDHNLPFDLPNTEEEISRSEQNNFNYRKFYYLEALSSESQKSSPLFNYRKEQPNIKAINRYVIGDYTTFPVFIIDERIQRLGFERGLFEKWKLMGIFVPKKEPFDSAEFPKDYLETYLKSLHHPLPGFELKRGKAALILHESLLQRWVGSEHVIEKLNELLSRHQDVSIFITTGRGKPQYLTEDERNIRFIPFSIVYRFCDEMNKFKLYSALQSARI